MKRQFTVSPKQNIKASSLGSYVGGRLLTNWTASLLVYGAEESDDYDYEQSFDGSLNDCLTKLEEYQNIMDSNSIDGYLTLEANNSDEYFEGDYDQIYEDLEMRGLV